MGDELDIKCSVDGDEATLVLTGNISTISSPYLAEELAKLDAASKVVLDIAAIDYISEAGFDLLTETRDALSAKGGSLVIAHPNDILSDMIDDFGLADQFDIVA